MASPRPSPLLKLVAAVSASDSLTTASVTIAGGNSVLICVVSNDALDASRVISSITWNGNALAYATGTRVSETGSQATIEWWVLHDATGGSGTVVVTWAASVTVGQCAVYDVSRSTDGNAVVNTATASGSASVQSDVTVNTSQRYTASLCGHWHGTTPDTPLVTYTPEWSDQEGSSQFDGHLRLQNAQAVLTFSAFYNSASFNNSSAVVLGNAQPVNALRYRGRIRRTPLAYGGF